MRKFRRFQTTGRRRKIRWESTTFTDAVSLTGITFDVFGVWIRLPSGVYDVIDDDYLEENETLIRLLPKFHAIVRGDNAVPGNVEVAQGIIAWPSLYDDDTIPAEIPSPLNGEFPWIWREVTNSLPLESSANTGWPRLSVMNSGQSRIETDVRAQRKLPSRTGILYCCVTSVKTISQEMTRFIGVDVRYAVKQA